MGVTSLSAAKQGQRAGGAPPSRTRNHPLLRSLEQERRNDTRRNSFFSSRNLQPQIASKSFDQRFSLNFDQMSNPSSTFFEFR